MSTAHSQNKPGNETGSSCEKSQSARVSSAAVAQRTRATLSLEALAGMIPKKTCFPHAGSTTRSSIESGSKHLQRSTPQFSGGESGSSKVPKTNGDAREGVAIQRSQGRQGVGQ